MTKRVDIKASKSIYFQSFKIMQNYVKRHTDSLHFHNHPKRFLFGILKGKLRIESDDL